MLAWQSGGHGFKFIQALGFFLHLFFILSWSVLNQVPPGGSSPLLMRKLKDGFLAEQVVAKTCLTNTERVKNNL